MDPSRLKAEGKLNSIFPSTSSNEIWEHLAEPFDSSFYCFPSTLFFPCAFFPPCGSFPGLSLIYIEFSQLSNTTFLQHSHETPKKSNVLNNVGLLKVCWVSEWLMSHYTVPVASQQQGCRGRKFQRHKMTERSCNFFFSLFFPPTFWVCFAFKHIESNISSKNSTLQNYLSCLHLLCSQDRFYYTLSVYTVASLCKTLQA